MADDDERAIASMRREGHEAGRGNIAPALDEFDRLLTVIDDDLKRARALSNENAPGELFQQSLFSHQRLHSSERAKQAASAAGANQLDG